MEKRILGKTGLTVGVLGFGGAEIGFCGISPEGVREVISEAIDLGLNLIDSAAAYLESEKLLGQALRGKRDRVHLVTKCGPLDGFKRSDWSERGLLASIEQSLKNLETDCLDVILLHSCGELEFSWGEAGNALIKAREKGYARFIGYSGDGASALAAIKSGMFDVLETSLSIADQEGLRLTLPYARQANMGVIVKRPIANAAWRYQSAPDNSYHTEYWRRLKKLDYPFLKSADAASTALGFTLAQAGVHCAIVGTTKPGRWLENARSLEKPLNRAEIEKIYARWKEMAEPDWVGQI